MGQRYQFADPKVPRPEPPKNPNDGLIAFCNGLPYEAAGRTEAEAVSLYIAMQRKAGNKVRVKDVSTLPYDITGRQFPDPFPNPHPEPEKNLFGRFLHWFIGI